MEKVTKADVIGSLSDNDILSNALRFAIEKCPEGESGELIGFQKYKTTFYKCMIWMRDNYKDSCDGFLNEVTNK